MDKQIQRAPVPKGQRIKAHGPKSSDSNLPDAKGECLDAKYKSVWF